MTVEIVILAMIAAFLGLRLYSVLGRRAEHEEEPLQARFDAPSDVKLAPPALRPTDRSTDRLAQPSGPRNADIAGVLAPAERALQDIAGADRRFDILSFVAGARSAYRMILEAFWRGDKDELAKLCDADVLESFAGAIDARKAAGETLENRLVRIEDATITDASLNGSIARITVRFSADIAALTRDSSGKMIAGSLDDAIEVRDLWTFSRNVQSADPDWLLDETDEA